MAGKRTYGDSCGIARALDLVGERWALLVVRELLLGPKRFTDLRARPAEPRPRRPDPAAAGARGGRVVARRKLDPPAGAWVYELTDRGRELEPIVIALGGWGSLAPFPPGDMRIGVDSTVLALKTLFDAEAAADRRDGRASARRPAVLGPGRRRVLDVARGRRGVPTRRSRPIRARSPHCSGADMLLADAEGLGRGGRRGRQARPRALPAPLPAASSAGVVSAACYDEALAERVRDLLTLGTTSPSARCSAASPGWWAATWPAGSSART